MPNDFPLLPPKNQMKHLDKTMISLPSDFRHLAHVGPMGQTEIETIRNSDNVLDALNEGSFYMKPSSSNNTLRSSKSSRLALDDAFPTLSPGKEEVIRGYENQPTTHQYINVLPPRPSRKNYKAPAPPTPPSQDSKPNLMFESENPDPPVVFRSISKGSNISEPIEAPKINTVGRIKAPKPNSLIIDRPGELDVPRFGLDDCIPLVQSNSPLKTLSPLHRPLVTPENTEETPILTPGNPPKDELYMSTIRSTSAQGKQILDDLDNWLDELDDDDREQLSTISTDESGYPTMALEKDREFMKHLVQKYELGVEPQTVRLRKKKAPAPIPPPEALSSPTFDAPASNPPFSSRPVSMPPNRPPPSYDAPSFDAPVYEPPGSALLNGRALTKQHALDIRSSDESGVPPSIARFLYEKRVKSATMPMSIGRMTTSSGFTDGSTTSSRSDAVSSAILSTVGEDSLHNLERCREIDDDFVPVPKPRTKISVSTEPQISESADMKEDEIEKENVIGEEFEVIETKEAEVEEEHKETVEQNEHKSALFETQSISSDTSSEDDEDNELIVTRF